MSEPIERLSVLYLPLVNAHGALQKGKGGKASAAPSPTLLEEVARRCMLQENQEEDSPAAFLAAEVEATDRLIADFNAHADAFEVMEVRTLSTSAFMDQATHATNICVSCFGLLAIPYEGSCVYLADKLRAWYVSPQMSRVSARWLWHGTSHGSMAQISMKTIILHGPSLLAPVNMCSKQSPCNPSAPSNVAGLCAGCAVISGCPDSFHHLLPDCCWAHVPACDHRCR